MIESGSRGVLEKLLPVLTRWFGDVEIDIVTCFADQPKGFNGTVFNVNEYGGPAGRDRLFSDLAGRNYQLAGVLATGDPIMTKWKWWLAYRLPAKIFIVNESSEFFWCDWGNLKHISALALQRSGFGASAIPALVRLAFLPVTVLLLVIYAAAVHLRRAIRLL